MMTIFFFGRGGKLGILGGKLLPSNTLDTTLLGPYSNRGCFNNTAVIFFIISLITIIIIQIIVIMVVVVVAVVTTSCSVASILA